MKIIFSKKCLEYDPSKMVFGHPETPGRVMETYNLLKNNRFEFVRAKPCQEKDILLVHSAAYVNAIKNENAKFFDADAPPIQNIFEYARIAAGAAIQASNIAFSEFAFSLMRPPGHHAFDMAAGFCYFNNIAIAISKLLKEKKIKKAAILDIDVHHGNGTQNIFAGDYKVLFISLHQPFVYPGTGLENKLNCVNFPLKAETKEKEYLKVLKEALIQIDFFKPDVLGISAGFDTYKEEEIANINLEIESYRKIGQEIKKLFLPTFAVLEGGYSKELPECIHQFLMGVGGS